MEQDVNDPYRQRIYANEGNQPLLNFVRGDALKILDIGCGAGDNASTLKKWNRNRTIYGITLSPIEQAAAARHMELCVVADVESGVPIQVKNLQFDAVLFSHVLEHLRDPAAVLYDFTRLLRLGGMVLIAVPNVLQWKQRWQFLLGRFEYTATGTMDSTHLRFFTYITADRYLLAKTSDLKIVSKTVTGSVPLWLARRYLLPISISQFLDKLGSSLVPNLFGSQVIIVAKKHG